MIAIDRLKELYLAENRRKYPALPYRSYPNWKDTTSSGLTRMVIDFLRLSGHQAERISNTGRMLDGRKVVTDVLGYQRVIGSTTWIPGTGTRGTADISATIRGLSVKIEIKCKATHDRQRPDQVEYQRTVERAGGLYIIATSFDQFYSWYCDTFGGAENE